MQTIGSLLMITALLTVPLHAQRTALTVSGFPVAFPMPTATDLTVGTLTSTTATTFTVQVLSGQPVARLTIVSIRCQAPCPQTGTKPVSSVSWRRSDLPGWTTLTTSDVQIESRIVQRNQPLPQSNNPWSNALYWQMLVGWMTDPPGSNSYNIVMTLTVTTP